ncbi:hypothetical protein ILP92_08185 [Maribius pontilimi]|uniref:Uncharacterized protein n=1 Tax=Palleronia pontilimi TaxID=1964209 RepID=A0A934MCP4_9RHOB|nr:hypothetical protein [Palleronia pontilimi]MBJ3762720.1 hypothetical protein [Palleronia pontilimi]
MIWVSYFLRLRRRLLHRSISADRVPTKALRGRIGYLERFASGDTLPGVRPVLPVQHGGILTSLRKNYRKSAKSAVGGALRDNPTWRIENQPVARYFSTI